MIVYPLLFFYFCDVRLCTTETGVMNQNVQSLLVKWKWVIIALLLYTNVLHLTLCFYWSLSTLCLQLPPPTLPSFPFPPPTNFPPPLSPSNPLLPSSVCFCSLNSLSAPLFVKLYYFALFILCLVDCKIEASRV